MGYLKRLALVLITICIVIGMSGCGGKGGFGKSSDNTLSGSFSPKNDSIWYYVGGEDEVGKDTDIGMAFVFKDGITKMYRISNGNFTLGEVAQMGDDEVIAKLEEMQAEKEVKLKEAMTKAKVGCDALLASGFLDGVQTYSDLRYDFSGDKVLLETISKSLVSYTLPDNTAEVKYGLKTDASGNNVAEEIIGYKYKEMYAPEVYELLGKVDLSKEDKRQVSRSLTNVLPVMSMGGQVNKSEGLITGATMDSKGNQIDLSDASAMVSRDAVMSIVVTNALDPTRGAIKVYDTTYTGYLCNGNLLLTNAGGKSFVMDDLKKEGVMVDPKDDDALFNQ